MIRAYTRRIIAAVENLHPRRYLTDLHLIGDTMRRLRTSPIPFGHHDSAVPLGVP